MTRPSEPLSRAQTERLVAQRIIDINARERNERRAMMGADRAGGIGASAAAAVKFSCAKGDFSEKANWENFRNEEFDGQPFTYTSGWQVGHGRGRARARGGAERRTARLAPRAVTATRRVDL